MSNVTLAPTYIQPELIIKNQTFTQSVFCAPNLGREIEQVGISSEPFGLSLYPNPASQQLFLRFDSVTNDFSGTLKMYTVLGQEVLSLVVESNELELDVSTMESGIYLIVLEEGGLVNTGVVVVEN